MALYLENTLSGELERFEPMVEGEVSIYYCGLTVSDRAHLGHARSWVHVDVLRRWLEYEGYTVRHVENFTDVNEKIVARVGERPAWTDEMAVAEHFIERTLADMRSLNLKRASAYPRVTEHIDAIIDLIERLIDTGHAYVADGSVYFDVTSFGDYGHLSNQSLDALEASEDQHPEKRHPADFALWKAGGVEPEDIEEHQHPGAPPATEACEGALTWASPWGDGRPGWHIECSAMSMTHLDETFDLHLAGRDIVFPHNENEIAQSEAVTGEPYARCWVHIDLLEVDDEKMSSSLRNFLTVEEAVDRFGVNVVRTFLLSAGHDRRQSFNDASMGEASSRWDRLDRAYHLAIDTLDGSQTSSLAEDDHLRSRVDVAREAFRSALEDNLDTRAAYVALGELAGAVVDHVDAGETPFDYGGLLRAVETFETLGGAVLGLDFTTAGDGDGDLEAVIASMLELRERFRSSDRYDEADAVRDALESAGIEIEDTDGGPRFRITSRPG